jgi:hypothetical protein
MKISGIRRKSFNVETVFSKSSNHRGTNTIMRMKEELCFGDSVPLCVGRDKRCQRVGICMLGITVTTYQNSHCSSGIRIF